MTPITGLINSKSMADKTWWRFLDNQSSFPHQELILVKKVLPNWVTTGTQSSKPVQRFDQIIWKPPVLFLIKFLNLPKETISKQENISSKTNENLSYTNTVTRLDLLYTGNKTSICTSRKLIREDQTWRKWCRSRGYCRWSWWQKHRRKQCSE